MSVKFRQRPKVSRQHNLFVMWRPKEKPETTTPRSQRMLAGASYSPTIGLRLIHA